MTETPDTVPDLAALLDESATLIEKSKFEAAETLLRQALEVYPDEPRLMLNLAVVLHGTQRSQQAELLLRDLKSGPPQVVHLMGEIYESLGNPREAFKNYKRALQLMPENFDVHMRLGALRESMGDKPGARECYRTALDLRPLDWAATSKYVLAIWDKDPGLAVKALEDVLNATVIPEDRMRTLSLYVCRKEWWERMQRGQMPYHATSVDELFFNYARPYVEEFEALAREGVAKDPTNGWRIGHLATARFCANNRHGAEEMWNQITDKIKGTITENVRFAPEFYDELRKFTDADLIRGLPPVIEIAPPVPDAKGVLYLSCNFEYFRAFALPMIVSSRERSQQTPIHIHIMDPSEEEAALSLAFLKELAPLRFALTIERPGLKDAPSMQARSYYHAVRFIRYYEHLKAYNCPLWLMDVDAVVNTDLAPLFAKLDGVDLSMRIRPGRMEPWNQFNACIVGASTSAVSVEYIRLTAAYLAYFFQRNSLRWGIDQLAMYGVYADMQDRGQAPSLSLLGEREVDYDYRDDGFVWCNSGAGKFQHLQRISKPHSLPLANFEDNKFVGVFERHWNKCERIAAAIAQRSQT